MVYGEVARTAVPKTTKKRGREIQYPVWPEVTVHRQEKVHVTLPEHSIGEGTFLQILSTFTFCSLSLSFSFICQG